MKYFEALGDWLGPHHDHVRPPPAVVLAEAAKQSEAKTGHAVKVLDLPTENGAAKKDREPPAVKESPASLTGYAARESLPH